MYDDLEVDIDNFRLNPTTSSTTTSSVLPILQQQPNLSATGKELNKKRKRPNEQMAESVFALVDYLRERNSIEATNISSNSSDPITTAIKLFKDQFANLDVAKRIVFQQHLSEFKDKATMFIAMDAEERSMYVQSIIRKWEIHNNEICSQSHE